MSLPDHLLDPPDDSICEQCGEEPISRRSKHLCSGCIEIWMDVRAEEQYEAYIAKKGGAQ